MSDQRLHPILAALLNEMPTAGSVWPKGERLRWFQAMAAALDLIYAKTEDKRLVVELKDPEA